jgi:hypothetical protein
MVRPTLEDLRVLPSCMIGLATRVQRVAAWLSHPHPPPPTHTHSLPPSPCSPPRPHRLFVPSPALTPTPPPSPPTPAHSADRLANALVYFVVAWFALSVVVFLSAQSLVPTTWRYNWLVGSLSCGASCRGPPHSPLPLYHPLPLPHSHLMFACVFSPPPSSHLHPCTHTRRLWVGR